MPTNTNLFAWELGYKTNAVGVYFKLQKKAETMKEYGLLKM